MIFSEFTHRKIQEKEDYSFFLSASIDNTTGNAAFGFSGSGEKFNFDFVKGRIIDPNDNYVYSYDTGTFQISGIINKENYNYYINEELISFSGTKNNFKTENFFIDCTGCSLDVQNLVINGSGQTVLTFQNMNQAVGDSGFFTGEVVANDPAFGKFDIFSGEILTPQLTGLFSILTTFSTGIESTGVLGISGIQHIENQTDYSFEAKLYTSFGDIIEVFRVSGTTPFNSQDLTLTYLSDLTSGGFPLVEKTGEYLASNTLFTGDATYATGLPISISLSYYSGHTGKITGVVTGASVTSSGQNYSQVSLPAIVIEGNGVGATATGQVSSDGLFAGVRIINGGSGYSSIITGVTLTSSGGGYTGSPEVIIGGNGEGGVIEAFTGNPASIYSGFITGLEVVSGGSGYNENLSLTLSGGTTGITGSGIALSSGPHILIYSGVTAVTVTAGGEGYFSEPVIEFSGGTDAGTNAIANSTILNGQITAVGVTDFGSRYTGVPALNVFPGLSGVILSYSGSGYTGEPTVIIENGGGAGTQVNALIGNPESISSGFITGFNLISGGSGYTGIPTIVLSGGGDSSTLLTGSGTAVLSAGFEGSIQMYSGASATALTGEYVKEFTGQFNLITGSGGNFYDFRDAGQITSNNLSYTGEIIRFNENSTLSIGVESEIDVRVTNLNYYDSLPLVAELVASGSGSHTTSLYVTGIK